MNIILALPSGVSEALLPMVNGAPATGIFAWVNNLIAQAYGVVLGAVIVIAVGIVIITSAVGKWKAPSILAGIVLAALFSWGCISGVNTIKTQIDQTTASGVISQENVQDPRAYLLDLQE